MIKTLPLDFVSFLFVSKAYDFDPEPPPMTLPGCTAAEYFQLTPVSICN